MPNILKVKATVEGPMATAEFGGRSFECLVGQHGVIDAVAKREGDRKTPLGRWVLVEGFYRPDRKKARGICTQALNPQMGWCDAPGDPLYNKLCEADYKPSHEMMWLEDAAYDYVAVMSYNLNGRKAPDGKGMGSAIFLHVWAEGKTHTAGCVALKSADLDEVLNGGVDMVEVVVEG